jgi:hypothetical protein
MLALLQGAPEQIERALAQARERPWRLPARDPALLAAGAMGGSAIGADLAAALDADRIPRPVLVSSHDIVRPSAFSDGPSGLQATTRSQWPRAHAVATATVGPSIASPVTGVVVRSVRGAGAASARPASTRPPTAATSTSRLVRTPRAYSRAVSVL